MIDKTRMKIALKHNRKRIKEDIVEKSQLLGKLLYKHHDITYQVNKVASIYEEFLRREKALNETTYKTFMKWFDKFLGVDAKWEHVQWSSELLNIETIRGFLGASELSISDKMAIDVILDKLK
jgi:hypothetical protein